MKLGKYNVMPTALLAELVGTFVLTTVAITIGQPLIVGFTLLVLVLALFSVSGANLNPAVTFGLWSVKKLNTVTAAAYWVMQFVGAYLALLVMQLFKGDGYGISFSSFGAFDLKIVMAELIAVAIFTFAIASAVQKNLADSAKSLAIGLGLMVGLYAGSGLLSQAAQNASVSSPTSKQPRATLVDGVVANPAIALASTEKAQQSSLGQLGGSQAKTPTPASRLGLETIVGTLVGAALGMNLYMVTAGENPFEKKGLKASVTRVFKKSSKTVKKTAKKAKK
jgi:glycerol uptake facilitator-like aquaporin